MGENICSSSLPALDPSAFHTVTDPNNGKVLVRYDSSKNSFEIKTGAKLSDVGLALGITKRQSCHAINILAGLSTDNNKLWGQDPKTKNYYVNDGASFNLTDLNQAKVATITQATRMEDSEPPEKTELGDEQLEMPAGDTGMLADDADAAITTQTIANQDTTPSHWDSTAIASFAGHVVLPLACAAGALWAFPPAGAIATLSVGAIAGTAAMVGVAVAAGETLAQTADIGLWKTKDTINPYAIATAGLIGTLAYPLEFLLPVKDAIPLAKPLFFAALDGTIATGGYTLNAALDPNVDIDYSSPEFHQILAMGIGLGFGLRTTIPILSARTSTSNRLSTDPSKHVNVLADAEPTLNDGTSPVWKEADISDPDSLPGFTPKSTGIDEHTVSAEELALFGDHDTSRTGGDFSVGQTTTNGARTLVDIIELADPDATPSTRPARDVAPRPPEEPEIIETTSADDTTGDALVLEWADDPITEITDATRLRRQPVAEAN